MIAFLVTIQEEGDRRVRVHCETPPGKATPSEINVGMEFKTKFKEWANGIAARDWRHETKAGQN